MEDADLKEIAAREVSISKHAVHAQRIAEEQIAAQKKAEDHAKDRREAEEARTAAEKESGKAARGSIRRPVLRLRRIWLVCAPLLGCGIKMPFLSQGRHRNITERWRHSDAGEWRDLVFFRQQDELEKKRKEAAEKLESSARAEKLVATFGIYTCGLPFLSLKQ